jgi:biopolymer transport protein ExbB
MSDILYWIGYGEIFVFFILLCASAVALAVGVERAIIFKKNSSKKTTKFAEDMIKLLREHDFKAAAALARESGDNVYTRFSLYAIDRAMDGDNALNELMEGRIIEERIFLEKRLTILNTLGNNAPFIGLLGTVLGVIKAFNGLGTLGNSGGDVVMRSISRALLATAAGLFIAIPVVMANNFFAKKVKVIVQHLEIFSREISASLYVKPKNAKKSKAEV